MTGMNTWALAAIAAVSVPLWSYQPQALAEPKVLVAPRSSGSYLGIAVAEITSERAKALNLREEFGVEITRLEEESPAAKGGLKTGDVVTEYNGQRVEGVEQFMRMVRETPPGRDVKLTISREGSTQQVSVRTGSRKSWLASRYGEGAVEFPRINLPEIRIPDVPRVFMTWRSSSLGIEAETLDSQLAEYFGVKEGVLVRSVVKGSAAEKAGLRAGDVITKVDETNVATPREMTSAIRAARSRKTVTVSGIREKHDISFTLSIEDLTSEFHFAMPKPNR